MKLRLRFKIPGWWVGLQVTAAMKKREGKKVMGICNKVGHRYVLFLDYDYDNKLSIYREVRSLQEKFMLGNAYIFKTRNGYHVIFLDLLSYEEFIFILHQSSCDRHYIEVPQMNDSRLWVLRLTPKKDGEPCLENVLYNEQVRAVSNPHAKLLEERGVPPSIINKLSPHMEEEEQTIIYARYEA